MATEINKVFGIGLGRTGTRSLNEALNILGIKAIHWPRDRRVFELLSNGIYRLPILEEYQAITDIVAAPYYAQFDREYPGSKFILTVREKESWLASVAKNVGSAEDYRVPNDMLSEAQKFFRAGTYGAYRFSRERFSYVYDLHVRNVRDYFRDRPESLLVLNICAGEGWELLCPFLGRSIPNVPFPHLAARSGANRRSRDAR